MVPGMTPFTVIMGVSGCGKSTIGQDVADAIGGVFLEGDSFHPPENKEKMGNGIALTDEDRWPWFDRLVDAAEKTIAENQTPVLACSALKKSYRDYLFLKFPEHRLVYLEGSFDLIKRRMDERDHEYMTSDLLKSQFATLEAPESEGSTLEVSIEKSPEKITNETLEWLKSSS